MVRITEGCAWCICTPLSPPDGCQEQRDQVSREGVLKRRETSTYVGLHYRLSLLYPEHWPRQQAKPIMCKEHRPVHGTCRRVSIHMYRQFAAKTSHHKSHSKRLRVPIIYVERYYQQTSYIHTVGSLNSST